MTSPLKHPQEIEVWYILPAIRRELVVVLKERGTSQKKIAEVVGIAQSAVSQYLTGKRGGEVVFPKEVKDFIRKCADKIKDTKTAYQQIQSISDYIRKSKALCKIHAALEGGLNSCDICYSGSVK